MTCPNTDPEFRHLSSVLCLLAVIDNCRHKLLLTIDKSFRPNFLTIPWVNFPERWSCFKTVQTCRPGLISARLIPFIRVFNS